jgi:hypothetical protein
MPRKRREQERHTYSVFVNRLLDDGRLQTRLLYFGDSEYTARSTLAKAIMEQPEAHSVDVRRDLRLLVRVVIERPSLP